MILSEEQTNCVRQWVAEGASIGDVQKRLKDEFSVVMTYMDTRFLIDDLDAELVSTPNVQEDIIPDASVQADNAMPTDDMVGSANDYPEVPESYSEMPEQNDVQDAYADSNDAQPTASNVKVSVSPIQRPDCIISGDVVFSDGSKAEWRIDRMGQLGIVPSDPNMNPPQEDIVEFQRQLQSLLR